MVYNNYKRNKETLEAPFGFRLAVGGVHIEQNPEEQRVISLISGLRAEGLSTRQIVSRLNSDRVPARGSKWNQTTIVRILKKAAA